MKHLTFTVFLLLIHIIVQAQGLDVHKDKRHLQNEDGTPFFWLADTGWEIFHKLTKEESAFYLRNRAGKGFNVIQTVLLGELNGLTVPNADGELPLKNLDPATPNEKYFEHVDWVVKKAAEYGIYLAITPTWGAHVEDIPHPLFENHAVFTKENARAYGEFLGNRYKDSWNIIWIMGGDRSPVGYMEIWDNMAEGISTADKGKHLMTYHIYGGLSSSLYLHKRPWLDFNMIQSGHGRVFNDNHTLVKHDYALEPTKPTIDGEPIYEDIPIGFTSVNGRATDYHCRVAGYQAVFAGAFGHTYGHNSLWQMYRKGDTPILGAEKTWDQAIHSTGSYQMQHLKNLMLSRPFFSRVPAQELLGSLDYPGVDMPHATCDQVPGQKNATYMMVYMPFYGSHTIKTNKLQGEEIRAWWFDPRTGNAFLIGTFPNTNAFNVPWNGRIREGEGGPDWVLVLDDASKNYPAPGTQVFVNR